MNGTPELGVELEHVPTMQELHAMLPPRATVQSRNASNLPTHYRPTPEGQQLVYDIMARNAERGRAAEKARRLAKHPVHVCAFVLDNWDGDDRPATRRCFYCQELEPPTDHV